MRVVPTELAAVKLVEMRLAVVESAGAELAEGPAEAQPVEKLAEVIEVVRWVVVL